MSARDKLTESLIKIINEAHEPLETKELEEKMPTETRSKIVYRLRDLALKGEIKGKMVGAGKGTWIWWRKDTFKKQVSDSE
jgi:predicted Zn-ribbon and HTH transcriptional regulator